MIPTRTSYALYYYIIYILLFDILFYFVSLYYGAVQNMRLFKSRSDEYLRIESC